MMPLGLYISVPFCKSKCSYCNFASDVFAGGRMQGYVDQLCADIADAEAIAIGAGGKFEREVDSIYFGGGTPSLLQPAQLQQIFTAIRERFDVAHDGEITVECAPGTLSDAVIDVLARGGVNRVSLGVQSFVDAEARSVGRLHTRDIALADIARLRAAGIGNINVDLIAGLPHQTAASWETSLDEVISSGEDSRLGRELIAGGTRYHAHFVPSDELTAELYERACERLSATGIVQYEISNFARPGKESRHNLKYWTRQPYLGFGVDAHSMLRSASAEFEAVRLAMAESLDEFMAEHNRGRLCHTTVAAQQAWEEAFFLGLRMNKGVNLREIERQFGREAVERAQP
ncbi:MAG: coproporphyrinogen III oxidase, partial [Acidobacteria bacterium]